MSFKVLVAGKTGQLGSELFRRQKDNPQWHFLSRTELDYESPHIENLKSTFKEFRPDFFINTVAYTQVDLAEDEKQRAYQVNAQFFHLLAPLLNEFQTELIHFSTDYVFDGEKTASYIEDDEKNPLGVYGDSKSLGEEIIQEEIDHFVIFRVSWLYSTTGKNFLLTMLRLGKEKEELTIVDDQWGAPTSINFIVDILLPLLPKLKNKKEIYHLVASGETSWAGFAGEIFKQIGYSCKVTPIPSSSYPTKAKRPSNSRLNCDKIKNEYDIELKDWREILRHEITLLRNPQ